MSSDNRKTGKILALIVILIFFGFAALNYIKASISKDEGVYKNKKYAVHVENSINMSIKENILQTGDIRSFSEVDVFSKVPGEIIKKIYVEKSDYIKKGTLIAELEDETILAKIEGAQAALESAQAAVKQAQANFFVLSKDNIRLVNLYKENAVSRQKLDHIQAQVKASKEAELLAIAQVKSAKAAIKQLNIFYSNHKIYAPIGGCVAIRYVDQGAMSTPGRPIVKIANDDVVKIITTVTEKKLPNIKTGMKVEINVDPFPEKTFTGFVTLISPVLNPVTRTVEVEIHINNVDRLLRPGMFAKLKFYMGEKKATVILRDSLVRIPGTGSVYVFVVENGKAVQKNITVGISDGKYVEVLSGIKPNELVVFQGQYTLKDGYDVSVQDQIGGKI